MSAETLGTPPAAAPAQPDVTQQQQPAEGQPQQAAKPTPAERKARLTAAASGVLGLKPASTTTQVGSNGTAKPEAQPTTAATTLASSSSVAATTAAIESAGGEAPERKLGESVQSYQARLTDTLAALRKAEGERETYKSEAATHKQRADQLEQTVERAKRDPVAALKLAGLDPDKFAEMMLKGQIKAPPPEYQLPPEVQAELEAARKEREERAAAKKAEEEAASKRAAAEAEAAQLEEDRRLVEQALTESAEQYPLLSAAPSSRFAALAMARDMTDAAQREGKAPPTLSQVFAQLQTAVESDAVGLLSDERAAKKLCSNEKVRATLLRVLGMPAQTQQPTRERTSTASPASGEGPTESTEGPKTLTQETVSEVPARGRQLTPRERQARKLEAARKVLGG